MMVYAKEGKRSPVVFILISKLFLLPNVCIATGTIAGSRILPLSVAPAPTARDDRRTMIYSKVEWKGKEYTRDEARTLLMSVITDHAIDESTRANALDRLRRIRSTDVTPVLLDIYPTLHSWQGKNSLIECLVWSDDPRGLSLFAQILDTEENDFVRLAAAYALARWNVRIGVAELVRLTESTAMLAEPAQTPNVRDNALDVLRTTNSVKDWGLPDAEIQEKIKARGDIDGAQFISSYVQEVKKWWSENQHRFPDWKPGDPLPEVEANQESPTEPDDK